MAAMKQYRANWRIAGLTKEPLNEGDTVKLDDEAAAPLVAGGALSLAGEKSATSAEASKDE